LVGLTHAEIEITNGPRVVEILTELSPGLVINTAGFLRVDECESVPEKACLVNGVAIKYLAEACAGLSATLVHFSTDYVFDGEKRTPYTESDTPSPINAYGLSKLMGEQFLRYLLPEDHLIVRTSGVYGPAGSRNKGGNFIETMLRLAGEGRAISVVDDQIFSPSYAPDLAGAVLTLISEGVRGTVHLTNSGVVSWHDFARRAFELAALSPRLTPISSSEFGAAARRPAYSVLDNGRAHESGLPPMRSWDLGLADYLSARRLLSGTPA
jgi:dTDP-4-dehydrorhamnose reductase